MWGRENSPTDHNSCRMAIGFSSRSVRPRRIRGTRRKSLRSRSRRVSGSCSSSADATRGTSPQDILVYGLNGVLLGVPFDVRARRVTGPAVPLVEGVMDADVRTGAMHFSRVERWDAGVSVGCLG